MSSLDNPACLEHRAIPAQLALRDKLEVSQVSTLLFILFVRLWWIR